MYFAALTLTELAPILTILAGMLVGFYGLLKFILSQAEKDRNAERGDRKEFSKALKDLTDSNRAIATATETAAKEAAERNGHLAELQIENQKLIINHHEEVEKIRLEFLSAVSNIDEQHVKRHVVDKEEVKLRR